MNQIYNPIAKWLHWLVAGMIVVQYVLAELAENAEQNNQLVSQLGLLANHKSVGITILVLAVIRLAWRFSHKPPSLPENMPGWQIKASHISHWSLYALLILLPITGWLMSSAAAYSVSWFNLIALPDFVNPDPALKGTLESIHEIFAKLLFVIALLHILAALKHALFDKDDVLARMSSTSAIALFVVAIALGIYTLTPTPSNGSTANNSSSVADTDITRQQASEHNQQDAADNLPSSSSAPATNSDLDVRVINYANSHIKFSATQAGAGFTGEWLDWQANVQFDPAQLAQSNATVRIQTAQVSSADKERDSTITGVDFFDSANFPTAIFQTNNIQYVDSQTSADPSDQTQYEASGTLTIKEKSVPILFHFNFDPATQRLSGRAELDRLALNVGTGDWTDTSWVGQYVQVEVAISFDQ